MKQIKEIWLKPRGEPYKEIQEDICHLINNGRITTATNRKKIGIILELLKWLESHVIQEREIDEINGDYKKK